jgi:hypothetical protein
MFVLSIFFLRRIVLFELSAGSLTHSVPALAGLLLCFDTERYDMGLGGRFADHPCGAV